MNTPLFFSDRATTAASSLQPCLLPAQTASVKGPRVFEE